MEEFCVDPLEWLCESLFGEVLSMLDAASLARCVLVSRRWKCVAQSDFLWGKHCGQLWKGKLIGRTRSMDPPPPRIRAYALSIEDGRRTQIKEEDLCSYAWNFWYKKAAGDYWVSCDPYWRGLGLMRRYFHRDGYVSADEDDLLWGGHECHWNFTETIAVNEEVNNSSAACIQINHWPPLKITRTPSWGWRMENFMFVYESSHPLDTSSTSS